MKSIRITIGLIILLLSVGLILVPVGLKAQDSVKDEIELTRTVIQAERQVIIADVLELTDQESGKFWVLYRDYRLEMAKVGDRLVHLIEDYAAQYETMTDQQAQKLIKEFFAIEKAKVDVKKKYLPKFNKILPAKKVIRFYQAENKMDAIIMAELAEEIPFVPLHK